MNILPKKRWHVRTRENIARVRKDEQQAAEETEEKRQRILKAEQEARTVLLRQRARAKYSASECDHELEEQQTSKSSEAFNARHINFFEELEKGEIISTKSNAETELEEKEKREKYEKQIGYLTYLGQDTVETTGNIPWYDKVPAHHLCGDSKGEENSKNKLSQDPLTVIRKYLPSDTKCLKSISKASETKVNQLEYHPIHSKKEKKLKKKQKKKAKKHKKRSSCSSDSSTDSNNEGSSEEGKAETLQRKKSLDQLRAERLKREKEERGRTEELLAHLQGRSVKKEKKELATPALQQKYNSQYNPELAKQNFTTNSWRR